MRFKEVFSGIKAVDRLSNIGGVNFSFSSTDKNEVVTPHYEIGRCLEIFENNSLVNTGITQLVSFILPNRKIRISSKDKWTVNFLEEWHDMRKGIMEEFRNLLTTNIACGTAPMEKHFSKMKNPDGTSGAVLDNVFSFNNMSIVYVNVDDMNGDKAYLIELPVGMKSFCFMGEVRKPEFHKIVYMQQYQFTFKMVFGISIPHWKFVLYKSGWSRDNIYGRSMLASAIDDANIMKSIKSSWDTIARTRQIDHKILTPDVSDPMSLDIDQDKLDDLAEQLEQGDKSYSLLSIPLKLLQQDINTSGKYDLMEGVFNLVRRSIQTALLPNVLTPWSDTATTQGAEAAMPPFISRIMAKQNEFVQFLNENVIDELRKTYPKIAKDASYVFETPKIMDDGYYISLVERLISAQMITPQEGRKMLFDLGIINEDLFSVEQEKKEPEMLSEAVMGTFKSFTTRLNDRYKDGKFSTSGWSEYKVREIGGHEVRIIDASDLWLLFDGLNLIESFEKTAVDKKEVNSILDKYIENLRKSFDKVEEEKTVEDALTEELEKEVQAEIEERLEKIFAAINKSAVKKESFLSINFLKKFDDAFTGFTGKINGIVGKVLNKLSVEVIEDEEENDVLGNPSDKVKSMLKDKNKILVDSLKTQIASTSDKMLADMKTSLATGIAAGKDVKDIKKDIEKQFDYEDGVGYKFNRIIQTSGRSTSGLLRLKKYQQMGFDEFKWRDVGDGKVRKDHRTRNGRVYKIKDALEGKMPYPGGSVDMVKYPNYNCRCRAMPW